MDPILVLGLANLVLEYGLPAATKMVMGLNATDITIEQIEALIVKPPAWYFDEQYQQTSTEPTEAEPTEVSDNG